MSNGAVVFHKTAKGVEEMEKRCHGLSPKVRRVLIMIDGKRSVDVLREMALADDLTHTIGALEEEGFIEVMGIAGAGGVAPAPAGPLPSITAFKDEPPPVDPMRLQLSRNFMANTINAFSGSLGNSSLLERLEAQPGGPATLLRRVVSGDRDLSRRSSRGGSAARQAARNDLSGFRRSAAVPASPRSAP